MPPVPEARLQRIAAALDRGLQRANREPGGVEAAFASAGLRAPPALLGVYGLWQWVAIPDRELVPLAGAIAAAEPGRAGPLVPVFVDGSGARTLVRCAGRAAGSRRPKDFGAVYARRGAGPLERLGSDLAGVLEAWVGDWERGRDSERPLDEEALRGLVAEQQRSGSLDICNRPLGAPGAAILASIPIAVGSVHLSGCGFTAEAARLLAGATAWRELDELSLDFNPLGDEGIEALAGAPWARQLRVLHVRRCSLGTRGLGLLLRGPWTGSLERLHAGENEAERREDDARDGAREAGPDGADPWRPSSCPRLAVLDLAHCRLGPSHVRALVETALPQLDRLDLGHNRLGDEGAAVLAGLAGERLRTLLLEANAIRDDGAVALSRLSLPCLEKLGLGDNYIHERGALALLEEAWWPRIETIDLRENPIGERADELVRTKAYQGRSAPAFASPPAPERLDGRAWLARLVEGGELTLKEQTPAVLAELGEAIEAVFERYASAGRRARAIVALLVAHPAVDELYLGDEELKARLRAPEGD